MYSPQLINAIKCLPVIQYNMNRQRPYRPQRSPPRDPAPQQSAYRPLRSQLSMLQEQNAILKMKGRKVGELQEKVEMVLKQNAQLLSENQKLSRFLHQQKSENEVLRNKVETLANQRVSLMGEFEQERKKLLRELELLGDRVSEEQALRSTQLTEIKSQFQMEMQNARRQHQSSESTYQLQVRKLREQLQRREHEVSDLATRLKRVSTESDYELIKLKQERERLRSELAYCESDRVKELQALKGKFESNYLEEVEALKRVHLNSLEEAQLENARLREALDDRTREADAMASKFSKQRTQLEDTIGFLRRDCEGYRNKIVETEQLGSMELGELRDKLQAYHEAELDDLREKQLMQVHAFEEELSRLESINHGKNIEIEQLIKDKVATRGIFDAELLRTRDEYAALLQRHKDLELKYADLNTQSNNRLADREKHIEYLEEVVRTQKSNHESESLSLQKLIETLKQELSNEKLIFRQNEQRFREELARAGNELGEAKTQGELQRAELERQVGDLRGELNGTSQSLNSRADALTTKNRMVERENEGLKNNITVKEKEIRNLVERLKASSDRETRLEVEIDQLRSKIIKREQKANETVGDQKTRLQASFNYLIENLKADHETALKLEVNRYRDLQEKLRRKEGELEQLLRLYKKMTDEIQVLTEQQAGKKEITLKFPGATADLIATKNLFDVYLKTKVLDVCGDALKENNK